MKRILKKNITHIIIVTIASPFILVEFILRKLGVLRTIKNIVSNYVEARTKARQERREDLISEVSTYLYCKNVDTYPSFWLGNTCMGSYSNGHIKVSTTTKGLQLIETLFHEDRHFKQEQANPNCFKDYIRAEDDYRGYIRQHVEKDARRYAYVKTMRYAKSKLGVRFYLFAPLYRLQSHPWKNVTLKKYR